MTLPTRETALRYGPLLVFAVVLIWHSLQYNFITDDAFISFVFSRNLAEHGSLVYNLGDAVEGYTNFLWTFILGLLMFIGLQPEITSLVLGTGFGVATLFVAFFLVEHVREERGGWAYLPPALLSMASGYACWSSGGLETQMFTFFATLGLYCYIRGDTDGKWLRRAGIFLALAALTRPEGMLITGIVGIHRLGFNLARDRRIVPSRDELWVIGSFAAVFAPWFIWKWAYYGYPFPNTYYVKAAGETTDKYDQEMLKNGLYYVWNWANQTKMLYAAPIAVAGLAIWRPKTRGFYAGTILLPLALIYLGYTVKVGGDFMGLHRFVMPVFVISAIGVTLGLALLASLVPEPQRRYASLGAALVVVCVFGFFQLRLTQDSLRWKNWSNDHGIDTPSYLTVYTEDRAKIGKHMRSCMKPDDFVIYGGAGAKPYYARTPGIDVFGLVSHEIAHDVKPSRPRAGHNKWGPDPLLATYEPTFIFSCYDIHRSPKRGPLRCGSYWRRNGFEQVTLHIPGLLERGEYYTFLVRKDRNFECEGLVNE